MTARVVRDWRGIKFKVSEYSTAELIALQANIVQIQSRMERFLGEIDAEVVDRALMPWRKGTMTDRSMSCSISQMSTVTADPQVDRVTSLIIADGLPSPTPSPRHCAKEDCLA